MPKRLHHVHGTKERPLGRRCLTFSLARSRVVIVDRVRPEDRDEVFARLWGHYGKGAVWQQSRRMQAGEQYVELDSEQVA